MTTIEPLCKFERPEKYNINKIYKNTKLRRNRALIYTGVDTALAVMHARKKEVGSSMFWGALGSVTLKFAQDCSQALKILKPTYNQIVDRAKRLKEFKKNNK